MYNGRIGNIVDVFLLVILIGRGEIGSDGFVLLLLIC